MFISSFLPSTGGQGSEQRHSSLTGGQRGRNRRDRPFCVIVIIKASQRNSSNMESELASSLQKSASQAALVVKNAAASAGVIRDAGSIPGSGRSPGGGRGNRL